MEKKITNLNTHNSKEIGVWKYILGFFVFLYKTAIRP